MQNFTAIVLGESLRTKYDFVPVKVYISETVQDMAYRVQLITNKYHTRRIIIQQFYFGPSIKSKVLPYSLPSVGPGANPGVQAENPRVTF